MILKTISIQQPWAGFVLTGRKRVENRNWASAYAGPILIHAGQKQGYARFSDWDAAGFPNGPRDVRIDSRFMCGMIVGIAIKGPCERAGDRMPPSRWHDAEEGTVWWPLTDAAAFLDPIPWRGSLGLFNVPCDAWLPSAIRPDAPLDHEEHGTLRAYLGFYEQELLSKQQSNGAMAETT